MGMMDEPSMNGNRNGVVNLPSMIEYHSVEELMSRLGAGERQPFDDHGRPNRRKRSCNGWRVVSLCLTRSVHEESGESGRCPEARAPHAGIAHGPVGCSVSTDP